jgi:hypothetical protein
MTTTLYTGGDHASHVELPVLPALTYRSGTLPLLAESILSPNSGGERARDGVRGYRVTRDYAAGVTTATCDLGNNVIECRVNEADPGQAALTLKASVERRASDGRLIETRAEGALSSTVDRFFLDMEVTLLENGKAVRTRRWSDSVARELL